MRRFVYYGASSGVSHTFIVNVYSLNIAFALYKINESATVCIRVRRSSDNAELDIGFVGNDLDNATLLSFIGTDDAFVAVFYNQGLAGATYNLTQTSGVPQPLIALGGVLYTAFGKTSILMGNRFFNINPDVFNNKSYGVSIAAINNPTTASRIDLFSFRTSGSTVRFFSTFNLSTANRTQIFTRRLDSDSASILIAPTNYTAGNMLRTDIIDWVNANAFIRENGVQVAQNLAHGTSGNTSATNSSIAGLGRVEGVTSVDRLSVWVVANTDVSTIIANIETNINDYYAIY